MYPVIGRIGEFEVTSFGVMVAAAALVGLWLFRRELARSGLSRDASDAAIWGLIGGLLGAKLLWVVEHLGEERLSALLFARGGLSWYGGFVGGIGVGLLATVARGLPLKRTLAAATPALAFGHLLGRIGCFLVGDDYGRPTNLPWGVAFPRGLPPSTAANLTDFRVAIPEGTDPSTVLAVHPTQLYEVTIMLVVFALLWTLRSRERATGWLFAVYLMLAGLERFFVEIFRAKDDRFLAGFTIAQLTSVVLIGIGGYLYLRWRDGPPLAPGPYLATVKK